MKKKHIYTYHNLNVFFFKFVLNLIFQLSDLLIYANRTTTPTLHFRVHGQMMLKDVTVLDSEPRLGQEHCFNLYDGKKAVLIAASSHAEKLCWMEDIAEAAQVSRVYSIRATATALPTAVKNRPFPFADGNRRQIF